MVDETSPLAGLLSSIQQRRESKHLDLRVDGLSDAVGHDVFIRYAACVPFEKIRSYGTKRHKARKGDWELLANLDLMVDSCIGVYAVLDGQQYGMSPEAPTDPVEWPRFDDDLRSALPEGVPESAVGIAQALFEAAYNEDERGKAAPEILSHGDRLSKFYGYTKDDDELGGS